MGGEGAQVIETLLVRELGVQSLYNRKLDPSNSSTISILNDFSFGNGIDIKTGTSTGTKIGTASNQKLGFFGVTPVNQPDTISDASDLTTCITAVNTIIDRLQELGLIA